MSIIAAGVVGCMSMDESLTTCSMACAAELCMYSQEHRAGLLGRTQLSRVRADFFFWLAPRRVAILGRFGGLYLDLDMVPMSRGLLHIPDGSLVLQDHKAGARLLH